MDTISLDMIEAVIKMAKANGVESFKYNGLEFSLNPTAPLVLDTHPSLVPQATALTGQGMPGDDHMLFYSTPAFDELAQDREDK